MDDTTDLDSAGQESHDGLVLLRSFSTRAEAQIAASAIAAEVIRSIVKGETDSSMYPVGTIHLFVDGDDLKAAQDAIGSGVELEADYSHGPGLPSGRARRAGIVMGLAWFVPIALLVLGAIVVVLFRASG